MQTKNVAISKILVNLFICAQFVLKAIINLCTDANQQHDILFSTIFNLVWNGTRVLIPKQWHFIIVIFEELVFKLKVTSYQ